MHDPRADDPAELIVAWEAVEELLTAVSDSTGKDVLRMVAAGLRPDQIADRLALDVADVEALAARARIRILTAAVAEPAGDTPAPDVHHAAPDATGEDPQAPA